MRSSAAPLPHRCGEPPAVVDSKHTNENLDVSPRQPRHSCRTFSNHGLKNANKSSVVPLLHWPIPPINARSERQAISSHHAMNLFSVFSTTSLNTRLPKTRSKALRRGGYQSAWLEKARRHFSNALICLLQKDG